MDSKSGVGVNLFYIIQNEYFRMAETKDSFVPWTFKFISASPMILCMYGCSFFIASLFFNISLTHDKVLSESGKKFK